MALQRLLIYITVTALPALASCAMMAQPADPGLGRKTGTIQSPEITEASGMVASRRHPDVLWLHNDSGGKPILYALNPQGKCLGRFHVTQARARDWEDIALGPGPDPEQDYLYIGDIGDNRAQRDSITVYRVPEPAVAQSVPLILGRTAPAQAIRLAFPGKARDAETLLVDPLNGDIYIITKREFFFLASGVYRAEYPQSVAHISTMKRVAVLPLGLAVAGDISPDGQWIIVRSMHNATLLQRPAHGPLAQAFKGKMFPLPLAQERQGEAICFDARGQGYYTTSEQRNAPIYYFPRPQVTDDAAPAPKPGKGEED
jgi:hypothetical protein